MIQKKRIEYLDAMRGLTMALVVYSHVHLQSFHLIGGGSFNDLFVMIRMPLFFFVSGFLLEKVGVTWHLKDAVPFFIKKMKVQLLPTFVFMGLYCYLFNRVFAECLLDSSKFGYWFTITLFEYFVLYACVKCLPYRYQMLLLGILAFCLCVMKGLNLEHPVCEAIQLCHAWYFSFFCFGVFVKRHFNEFLSFLDSKGYSCILVVFFIVAFLRIKGSFLNELPFQILQVVVLGFMGICLVFNFFRKYQCVFTKDKALGKMMQYIGKRTLDIYLLHYFFVPQNLGMVGTFLKNNYNPTIEFFCSITLAILIIGLCLIISNLIRTSPLLGHLLFGVKKIQSE